MTDAQGRAEVIRDAVAHLHALPLGMHRVMCRCERHAPGESNCTCPTCVAVREGRCPACGR